MDIGIHSLYNDEESTLLEGDLTGDALRTTEGSALPDEDADVDVDADETTHAKSISPCANVTDFNRFFVLIMAINQ
jgi:hypothetical protein